MTAEVLAMNKEAVSIAADSAATLTGEKIFLTNKIFSLSKKFPIGIMIYNNLQYCGIPWETIIKEYRKKNGNREYDTLVEYSQAFLAYLNNFPITQENLSANNNREFSQFTRSILDEIRKHIYISINCGTKWKKLTDTDIKSIVTNIVDENYNNSISFINTIKNSNRDREINFCQLFPDEFRDNFLESHKDEISNLAIALFERLPIKGSLDKISVIVLNYFFFDYIFSTTTTGVVITGFGETEYFPSYNEFIIYGGFFKELKYVCGRNQEISTDNLASVCAFAQEDVCYGFMEGIFPNNLNFLLKELPSTMKTVIDDSLSILNLSTGIIKAKEREISELVICHLNTFFDKFDYHRGCEHSQKSINIIRHLSKEELSEFVESLVYLTSIKRRVSYDIESVSKPIDVAVISKSEGFIWIKRKHYFTLDKNLAYHLANIEGVRKDYERDETI